MGLLFRLSVFLAYPLIVAVGLMLLLGAALMLWPFVPFMVGHNGPRGRSQ